MPAGEGAELERLRAKVEELQLALEGTAGRAEKAETEREELRAKLSQVEAERDHERAERLKAEAERDHYVEAWRHEDRKIQRALKARDPKGKDHPRAVARELGYRGPGHGVRRDVDRVAEFYAELTGQHPWCAGSKRFPVLPPSVDVAELVLLSLSSGVTEVKCYIGPRSYEDGLRTAIGEFDYPSADACYNDLAKRKRAAVEARAKGQLPPEESWRADFELPEDPRER
jgi:hypothetical protein